MSEDECRGKADASQIYLLTGKNYRISRSIKVQWFFQHFNCVVSPNPDDIINSSSEELEVLSVLYKGPTECPNKCTVVPSTLITFLGRIYKFVFCLDASQSLANVDILSGKVVNEILFESFRNCMRGLVLPFTAPGSTLILSPELHITVLGYNGVMDCGSVQVLVEGCLVTQENVECFLSSVHEKLEQIENKNASVAQMSGPQDANDGKPSFSHVTSEMSIVSMLKMSLLALQLLPNTASGGIVIISDGVFGLPSATIVDALLAQLRSHTVCCSFVKVGSPFQTQCSFGYIPNADLMQFLAVATSGAYLYKAPPIKELSEKMEDTVRTDLPPMNFYHKAFLCWSFQREYDLSKITSWEDDPHMEFFAEERSFAQLCTPLHQWKTALAEPLMRKRHLDKNLKTTISSVLSVRLREGYCIKDVTFLRGGKELVVKLLLLWKQNVHIEYMAAATWPVAATNPQTRIEVVVQGTYEFLHDVYSKQLYSMKGYRANVVETFNHTLKNLEMTDALLVSLQSFSSNRVYYSIPESARRGVPLFYLPPGSPQPVLSLEQGKSKKSSKSQEAQFAVFWKTILSLDVNLWQRWMHCHRINMVLEHDRPLPKSLFLPSTNDRFYHVQCRVALSSLAAFLKQWSSFVLLENHTYIKFMEGEDPEDPPKSFCILRISSKAPCVVIRLAFLGGMPGKERHNVVNSLRDQMKAITAQFAPPGNLSKDPYKESANQVKRQIHEQMVCTKLLHKPLDRILVRYDEQPKEFLVRAHPSSKSSGIMETFQPWMHRTKGATESPLKVLSRYLYHQRWVFTLHHPEEGSTSSSNTVSKILRCLTKLREDQGYKFIASNLGVTTMFKELWVKETSDATEPLTTCVVQFVMFPPLVSTHNRVAGWALDSRLPEDDRDLQLVMEVWVEPQQGVIMENERPEYLVGKHYYEVPSKIFEADLAYISAWLTYDHLRRMCDDHIVGSPSQAIVDIVPPPHDPEKKSLIYEVPFPFDVLNVLKRSRQAELLFSTLIENERAVPSRSSSCRRANDILFEYILEHMKRFHDRELTLTPEDSRRFVSLIRNVPEEIKHDGNITWRCFTRVENSHLLLTFVPASYHSLQMFLKARTDLERQFADSASSDGIKSSSFRKRQSSSFKKGFEIDNSDTLDLDTSAGTFGKFWCSEKNTKRSCVDLALFVYDFAVSSLTGNVLSSDTGLINNLLLDYRNKLDQFEQDSTVLDKSKELHSHCMAIYDLFLWCFVSTVFESLRRGEHVDDDNLDEVLAICGDHIPEEIDITEFLGNICGHIGHSSRRESQSAYSSDEDESLESQKRKHEQSAINFLRSNHHSSGSSQPWDGKCEELDGVQDFIQKRFSDLLGKYFAPIPNKRDYYFYRPYFLQDSAQSIDDGEEMDEETIGSGSDTGSDVVFEIEIEIEEKELNNGEDESHSEHRKDVNEENLDGDEQGVGYSETTEDELDSLDKHSDFPSDKSDIQSSIKDGNMEELRDLEQQCNVPLFLNLSCTIRDKSHLSSTMVSMSVEYLPTCLADILDQARRDPDQCLDPSISSLQITLDLICLVPPREPDYSRWRSRSRHRARSSSVSSLSSISDSPLEKMVRFEDATGANKSVSVSASHDRESSFIVSGLPCLQIESIREIRDDVNWLLQDEIVFSLCHVHTITIAVLDNVTVHIRKSQELEMRSSRFSSMRLDFVLDSEQSLAIFIEELQKTRIGGYKLSTLGNYYYLRLPSFTSSTRMDNMEQFLAENEEPSKTADVENEVFTDDSPSQSAEDEVNMDFAKTSSRHQSMERDNFSEMWLILRKSESDVLDVFFHTRESHDGEYYYLYTDTTTKVKDLCYLVNQKMLLRDVYEERICHPLLQQRSEDDIWNESWPYSTAPHSLLDGRDGSKVVHPEYRFAPGYFKCPVKWTKNFPIHFRLKGNTSRNTATDRAIKALQTVLNKFSLNEKTNMYVYREKTGDIFYFSLDESLCVNKEAEVEGGPDNADYGQEESYPSQPNSPTSSFLSLSKAGTAELEEDLDECSRKRSAGITGDKDSVSLSGSLLSLTINEHVEKCIVLSVHGVTEPSDEIKKDLVSVFQKRLDDFTLEMLTMFLARNPNTKLAYQDVQFIQPKGSTNVSFIRLVLPAFASKNLHPFSYFFKQHLLQYLNTPRYTTKMEAYHFKKLVKGVEYSKTLPENDVFIFSKPYTPGAKGVACLSINITDSHGSTLQITPDQKEIGFLNLSFKHSIKEFTQVEIAEEPEKDEESEKDKESDNLPDNATIIEISVWERGDVGLGQLKERLRKAAQHSLCDVLIEYYLLTASLSYIPERCLAKCDIPECSKKGEMGKSFNIVNPHVQNDYSGLLGMKPVRLSHRRTPSAGSLGCGRKHSPVAPSPVHRSSTSEPVSPVCFGPSSTTITKGTSTDKHEVPALDFTLTVDEEESDINILDNKEIGSLEVPSKKTLSSPTDMRKKPRSRSEDSRTISKSFQPITRSLSHSAAMKPRSDSEPHNSESGRFSPFETFTENELTESKEFGDEAVKANNGSLSVDTDSSRKTSSESTASFPTKEEIEMNKRRNEELKEERVKYENGEKGQLHSSFQGPAQELLQFAKDLDTPSIHAQKGTLLTRYSVDAVLYELTNLVKILCPDMISKIYRAIPSNPTSIESLLMLPTHQYVLYDPIRSPLHASDKQESSADMAGSYMVTSARPASSFLFISRNVPQWRSNLQKRVKDSSYVEPGTPSMLVKDFYASQQFQSWNFDCHDEAKGTTAPFSNCSPGFVSRQRLIIIDVKDKEIMATTYNLSNDVNAQFTARFTRLINWNNARCHLVSCLFQQKMGLFHHSTFQGLNVGKKEINPFCETVNDHHLFSLLKQTAPSSPEKSTSGQKQIPPVGKLLFEETLRDIVPPRPLQTTKHCSFRDPVKRHGSQFQEIRAIQIRRCGGWGNFDYSRCFDEGDQNQKAVRNAELQNLFTSWLAGPFNNVTGDNSISLLKRQSRLVHCCKTPFLASEEWMESVQEKAILKVNQEEQLSKENDNQDDGQQRPCSEVKEDKWHYNLREEFINDYTQYLQSQRFALVQSDAPVPLKTAKGQKKGVKPLRKKGVSDRPKIPNGDGTGDNWKPLHYYLQKTTDGSIDGENYAYDGGIMLMELGFEGCHFFVKLYAFESSRLLSSPIANQQTKNTFLAKCSKVKELTHLNSFSYDFHLRHAQYFLFGQRLVFPKTFRLTSMLTKLMKVYIYPPKFSWNHVCRGQLSLKLCSLPRSTVFSYIVEHAQRYHLRPVEMSDKQDKHEHVLVSSASQDKLYDVSLLAKLKTKAEENSLELIFFVVMTHRRELFPKMKAEIPRRKESVGFIGDAGHRHRLAVLTSLVPNAPEPEEGCTHGPLVNQDDLKRSASSPLFVTSMKLSQSQSDVFRHMSPTSGGSSASLANPGTSLGSSQTNVERPYVIKGLEADSSDSLMSWDMRNLATEADKCYNKLYSTVSTAQQHCMRDHLWHLLLRGTNSEETTTEGNAWKSKGLRKKTEYRRTPSDFTETWTVPSSLKDVADSKSSISCEDFEYLLDLVQPFSLPTVDETLKLFLSMDRGWYISLWSYLMFRFGDRAREFSKCDGKMHYFVLLNPKNLDMFIFFSVHEEKRLSEVKIAIRTTTEESKKSSRIVPKSCDDFVQEVVNALCYQMWTGLLLG